MPWSAPGQMGLMEDALLRKPDAMQYHPIDPYMFKPVLDRYKVAGIPVYQQDEPITSEGVTGCARFDGETMGHTAALFMAEYAKKAGKKINALLINGDLGSGVGRTRAAGFKAGILENSDVLNLTIESAQCNWTETLAADAVMSIVPSHPEVNAIYEAGSMTGGVIEGLRSTGRLYPVGAEKHIFIVANDDAPRTLQGISEGYVDGCVEHSAYKEPEIGFLQLINHTVLGLPIQRDIQIASHVFTPEEVGTDVWNLSWGNLVENNTDIGSLPIDGFGYIEFGVPYQGE